MSGMNDGILEWSVIFPSNLKSPSHSANGALGPQPSSAVVSKITTVFAAFSK